MMGEKLFSLAYLTLPSTHPLDQIQIAALCGYHGVGLRTLSQNWPSEKTWSLADPVLFHEIKSALHDTKMRLFDIELGRIADGVDTASFEPDFARAEELGAISITTSIWTKETVFARSELKKMAKLAAKYHLILSLEFVPFAEVKNLQQALQWLDIAQDSNINILVDMLHAYRTKITPEQLQQLQASQVGCVHICDGPAFIPPLQHPDMIGVTRSARLYPGEGAIPIATILRNMPAPPYYAIELPNSKETTMRGQIGHARKCLRTTKEYFRVHNL